MNPVIIRKCFARMAIFVILAMIFFAGCKVKDRSDELLKNFLAEAGITEAEYQSFLTDYGLTDKEFREFLVEQAKGDMTVQQNLPKDTGDFQAENLDGAKIGKEVFAGHKLTVLNVWATWCGPCLQEMPDLEKVSNARKKEGVQMIGIVIDTYDDKGLQDKEKIIFAKSILERTGVTYEIIQPDQVLNRGLLRGIQAVPTTFFIDSNGQLVGDPAVGSRSESSWNKLISERLAAL